MFTFMWSHRQERRMRHNRLGHICLLPHLGQRRQSDVGVVHMHTSSGTLPPFINYPYKSPALTSPICVLVISAVAIIVLATMSPLSPTYSATTILWRSPHPCQLLIVTSGPLPTHKYCSLPQRPPFITQPHLHSAFPITAASLWSHIALTKHPLLPPPRDTPSRLSIVIITVTYSDLPYSSGNNQIHCVGWNVG